MDKNHFDMNGIAYNGSMLNTDGKSQISNKYSTKAQSEQNAQNFIDSSL